VIKSTNTKSKAKSFLSILASVATILAFVLSFKGVIQNNSNKDEPRAPQHLTVERSILAQYSIDYGVKKKLSSYEASRRLPEDFKLSYKGEIFERVYCEYIKVKNIGKREVRSSDFHEKIQVAYPDSVRILSSTSENVIVSDKSNTFTVEKDLLNPGESIEGHIFYVTDNKLTEGPKVDWTGKIVGESIIDFKVIDRLNYDIDGDERSFRELAKVINASMIVYFVDGEIAVYLLLFSIITFVSLYLYRRSNFVKRSSCLRWFVVVGVMIIAVASSEVCAYIILGRMWAAGAILWSVWIPILLFQVAIWLMFARSIPWRKPEAINL